METLMHVISVIETFFSNTGLLDAIGMLPFRVPLALS